MTSTSTATTTPTAAQAAASPVLPDLTLFLVLHRGLRTDARRLTQAVAALAPTDERRVRALVRWYGHYRAEVHEHHETEDGIFFPALLERVAVFDRHLGRIEAEHGRLTGAVDALAVSLDHLASAAAAGRWAPAHAEALGVASDLQEAMTAHLDFEDADVLPLYVRHFGAAEYEEIGERALKRVPPRLLPFVIPWAMEHATAEERTGLYANAPLAFKVLWHASRHRHHRRVVAALGAAPAVRHTDPQEVR